MKLGIWVGIVLYFVYGWYFAGITLVPLMSQIRKRGMPYFVATKWIVLYVVLWPVIAFSVLEIIFEKHILSKYVRSDMKSVVRKTFFGGGEFSDKD